MKKHLISTAEIALGVASGAASLVCLTAFAGGVLIVYYTLKAQDALERAKKSPA